MPITLASHSGPQGTRLLGLGHYRPANVITNDDLVARGVDTNDEWIRTRVGIAERRWADPNETVVDMAEQAASKALAASGVSVDDVDFVLVATCTMPTPVPAAAPQLAHRLGIDAPGAYDISSGCSGFVYAVNAASAAIRAGQATNVLVVAAERFSGWLDMTDRSTCIILADGAGAAVVGRGRRPPNSARWCGAATAGCSTASPSTSRAGSSGRTARPSTAGPPARWRRSRSRPASRPDSLPTRSPRSCRTRRTCASSRHWPNASGSPTPSSRATSSLPGTPRRRRSRSHSRAWSRPARSRPARRCCTLGFGSGLAYAGQVVLAP